jgi:hypothetical protein
MPALSVLAAPMQHFEIYEDGNCIREFQGKAAHLFLPECSQVHRVQHIGKWRKRVKSFIRFFWCLLGNTAEEN